MGAMILYVFVAFLLFFVAPLSFVFWMVMP